MSTPGGGIHCLVVGTFGQGDLLPPEGVDFGLAAGEALLEELWVGSGFGRGGASGVELGRRSRKVSYEQSSRKVRRFGGQGAAPAAQTRASRRDHASQLPDGTGRAGRKAA